MSFNESIERDKLFNLDLTEDVIELILKKKRSKFELLNKVEELPDIDPIPEPDPEPEVEPVLEPVRPPDIPVETPTPPPSLPVIVRRLLPWQRRRL